MTFEIAFEYLYQGEKMSRKGWRFRKYIEFRKEEEEINGETWVHLMPVLIDQDGEASTLSGQDITATDWIVVD